MKSFPSQSVFFLCGCFVNIRLGLCGGSNGGRLEVLYNEGKLIDYAAGALTNWLPVPEGTLGGILYQAALKHRLKFGDKSLFFKAARE